MLLWLAVIWRVGGLPPIVKIGQREEMEVEGGDGEVDEEGGEVEHREESEVEENV